MSGVELSNKEVKARIDALLEEQLDMCVAATYTTLMQVLIENARAGRKKFKGKLIVGFNPRTDFEDIVFDIEKKEIVQLWLATLGERRVTLKALEKYPSKYDIFCWHDEKYCTFGLKFFSSWFPVKTRTGKLFVRKLTEKLASCGMRVTCSWMDSVTHFKISYSCSIPKGYNCKA